MQRSSTCCRAYHSRARPGLLLVVSMSGVKLGWKSQDQIYKETVTIPVVVGLVVVVVTVLALYLLREGKARGALGSRRTRAGGKSVRRSVR